MLVRWVVALAVGLLVGAPECRSEPSGVEVEAGVGPTSWSPGLWCFAPPERGARAARERALLGAVEASRLRGAHEALCATPHPAGSEGDRRVIEWLASAFEEAGCDRVEVQELDVYLCRPVSGAVTVVLPGADGEEELIGLPVREPALEGDPWSGDAALSIGWNAYSESGVAEGPVVYANYARPEDFARLAELGVVVRGSVVVARYGRMFRGDKARAAERAGARALVLYTDPADSGYGRGVMYPEGGWATPSQIERGSIKTLAWPGDPLTPGRAALAGGKAVERLLPSEVGLPRILVQPIGWAAANQILMRMSGPAVPADEWQGGLPYNYRVTGGDGLRVRVSVDQPRELTRTANVIGVLEGSASPEELVIIGGHHDAWTHGAGDPGAGLMCVVEAARVLGGAARTGDRPRRTVLFAAWAAEEYGLVGSTEWVESREAELRARAVAYVNLDMSAMGPDLWASATPVVAGVVTDAARDVPWSADAGRSVLSAWSQRREVDVEGSTRASLADALVGELGGGGDHVAFASRAGVPAVWLGAGGSAGVAYHSAYDTLAWYRRVVGDDYGSAVMVTRMAVLIVDRLANASVLPLDPTAYARRMEGALDDLAARSEAAGLGSSFGLVGLSVMKTKNAALEFERYVGELAGSGASGTEAARAELAALNRDLIASARAWLSDEGLPERGWYRNLWVAPSQDSAYRSWVLPGLRWGIERGDAAAVERWSRRYVSALSRLDAALVGLGARARTLRSFPSAGAGAGSAAGPGGVPGGAGDGGG